MNCGKFARLKLLGYRRAVVISFTFGFANAREVCENVYAVTIFKNLFANSAHQAKHSGHSARKLAAARKIEFAAFKITCDIGVRWARDSVKLLLIVVFYVCVVYLRADFARDFAFLSAAYDPFEKNRLVRLLSRRGKRRGGRASAF